VGVGGAVSRRTLETLNDAVDLLVRGLVAAQGLEGPVRGGSCVLKDPIRAFIVSKGSFATSTAPPAGPRTLSRERKAGDVARVALATLTAPRATLASRRPAARAGRAAPRPPKAGQPSRERLPGPQRKRRERLPDRTQTTTTEPTSPTTQPSHPQTATPRTENPSADPHALTTRPCSKAPFAAPLPAGARPWSIQRPEGHPWDTDPRDLTAPAASQPPKHVDHLG